MTTSQSYPIPTFTAGGKIYRLSTEAKPGDLIDQINARMAQLSAMLNMVIAEGSERFGQMSAEIKDDYLWGCSMLCDEARDLFRALQEHKTQ